MAEKPEKNYFFEAFMNDERSRMIILLDDSTAKDFQLVKSEKGGLYSTVQSYATTVGDCEFYRAHWNKITPMESARFIDRIIDFQEGVISDHFIHDKKGKNKPRSAK